MKKVKGRLAAGVACACFLAVPAYAQSGANDAIGSEADDGSSETDLKAAAATGRDAGPIEEILVVAQKKARAERLQAVPIAITALGTQQIEDAQLVTLADIGSRAPNVSTAPNGTFGGVANFSIRGLGSGSSIASIEPAVGVFVDGVYLGTNFGIVLDTFDLESIEILRGPQGTLQGRNVTGGAVMVRTQRPGNTLSINGIASIETGPSYTLAASVGGPIVGDVLKAKLTGYYKNDEGWFRNQFNGRKVGQVETWFVRPSIVFSPTENLDVTAIYERGRNRGDGQVAQNASDPSLTGFEVNYNEPGYLRTDWEALTVEANLHVGFGDGTITNVFGVRSVLQDTQVDLDASTATYFHGFSYLDQRQLSNELRYAGTFGSVDLTAGLFYFEQDFFTLERRFILNGAIDRVFGGSIDQSSFAVFAQGDIQLTDNLTMTLGGRYSTERKTAEIDKSPTGLGASNCSYETKTCPFDFLPTFEDSKRWSAFTPKVGLSWQATPNFLLYGNWSQGIRSGGYNTRSTSTTVPPGPFDMERQNAFELGFKSDLADRRVRLNGAAFLSKMSDLQRDVAFTALPPEVGTVQVIRNAVDADIYGFEGELIVAPSRALRFNASLGYTDSSYRNVRFDLNGDGAINEADRKLKPPRLIPWTYDVGMTVTQPIGGDKTLRANINYGYRSKTPITDQNNVYVRRRQMLTAFVELDINENLQFSIYGRNLLNQVWNTSHTIVTLTPPLYSYYTLDKGRVIGGSIRVKF